MKRNEKYQIVMLVLIAILLFCLIFSIIVLLRNLDEIKKNPVDYAIEEDRFGLDRCTCFTDEEVMVSFPYTHERDLIYNWTI